MDFYYYLCIKYCTVKKLSLLISLFAVALSMGAQTSGEYVFEFLRLPASSHVAAVGGENITMVDDDATLAIHNPALLQGVSDRSISLGYMRYMEGVSSYSADYVHALGDKATLGFTAQYLDYGTMKETDAENNLLGDFKANDLAIGAMLSYNLGKNVVGGVATKFVYSTIGAYHSTGVAVDLGLNYYNESRDLSLSAVVKNLGGQLSAYDDEYEPIPLDLQLGVSKRLNFIPLRLSLTLTDLNHLDYALVRHAVLGADLNLSRQIYIAAGYNIRRAHEMKLTSPNEFGEQESSSHGAGLTLGAGLQLERFKLHVSYGKYHVSSSSLMFNVAFTL